MDFMWKGKVIKAILQKEKFDMPPSTASLEKDLNSDDKRTKQTKKKNPGENSCSTVSDLAVFCRHKNVRKRKE